jgi:DNA-binding NarL/FixJ family response regulator
MYPKIFIISPYRFQNTALMYTIQKELGMVCTLCTDKPSSARLEPLAAGEAETRLILWDYLGHDLHSIWRFLNPNNGAPSDRLLVALFNVDRKASIEHQALQLGMRGIFYADQDFDLFKKGIEAILHGELWYSRKDLSSYILDGSSPAAAPQSSGKPYLTPREEEILTMIACGKSNIEIAENLYISPSTVKTHVYNIFQKINVPNRIQAALWTVQHLGSAERGNGKHA